MKKRSSIKPPTTIRTPTLPQDRQTPPVGYCNTPKSLREQIENLQTDARSGKMPNFFTLMQIFSAISYELTSDACDDCQKMSASG